MGHIWQYSSVVDTSSHQLSASCNIASSFARAAHGQTPARAAYSRVATHRPPFVRRHYCRTPTTTQSLYQFHLVCVIVCAAKETIFLLSKTPVSSGSATNSHRNLTDFFIISVLLIYSICNSLHFQLVRSTVLDGEISGDMITVLFYLFVCSIYHFILSRNFIFSSNSRFTHKVVT